MSLKKISLTVFFIFVISFLCFSGSVKEKMTVKVFNLENEQLRDVYVEIETSIDIYRGYTDQNGQCKFKFRKEEGETISIKLVKDTYKTTILKISSEELNSQGNLIIKLEKN